MHASRYPDATFKLKFLCCETLNGAKQYHPKIQYAEQEAKHLFQAAIGIPGVCVHSRCAWHPFRLSYDLSFAGSGADRYQ